MEPQPPNTLARFLTPDAVEAVLAFSNSRIALVGEDGSLLDSNPAFQRAKTSDPGSGLLADFVAVSSHAALRDLFRTATKARQPARATLELLTGSTRSEFDCQLIPLPAGNLLFLAEPPARLIRELQEARRALRIKQTGLDAVLAQVDEIAHTDQLTFLSNQRKIVGELQRRVSQSGRSRKPLTIFLLDIDRFKQVNDTYGHVVGDQVLRALAGQLREGIRQSDHVGRYGGEEFLILLPGTALESAIPMAERLLSLVRSLQVDANGRIVSLTISIGIAQYRRGETWKEFLERADKALYQSKANGRDEWSVSKPETS